MGNPILGRVYHAPTAFRGSMRYYRKRYADAMALIRQFGPPHLFVTFTMNCEAPELKSMMNPGQKPDDRPDLVCRLFIDKLKEFMDDLGLKDRSGRDKEAIAKYSALGPVKAWFYSLEHQKG